MQTLRSTAISAVTQDPRPKQAQVKGFITKARSKMSKKRTLILSNAELPVQAVRTNTIESVRSAKERTTNMIFIVSEKPILVNTTMFMTLVTTPQPESTGKNLLSTYSTI